ncbi:MAG: TonB family protein [Gemmatimonadaceae bacterium]
MVGTVALIASLAACVTATSRVYLPTEEQGRFSSDQLRDRADAFLGAECARLMGNNRSAAGSANYSVIVDAKGQVTEARMQRTSGDERLDQIFGALAAQLAFPPPEPPAATTAGVTIGYSCSPGASVSSVQLKQ